MPAAPRIAVISPLPPFRGGISDFGMRTVRALSTGADVFPVNYRVQYPGFLFPGKTQFIIPPPESPGPRLAHPLSPLAWEKTVRYIKHHDVEAVVIAYWHAFFAPMATRIAAACRNQGIPVYGLFHNVTGHDGFPFEHALLKAFLNRLNGGITLSSGTAAQFQELAGRPSIALFHPAEKPAGEPVERTGRKPVLLHAGLIRPYKGVDVLLRALDRIPGWDLHMDLVLAGENYMGDATLFEGVSTHTRSRITYINRFLTDDEMSRRILEADALVLPYRTASQSGIMAQAVGACKPVLVSDLEGLTGYIQPGKTGWSAPAGSVEGWVTLLDDWMHGRLIADPDALTRQQQAFSWERFGGALLEALNFSNLKE